MKKERKARKIGVKTRWTKEWCRAASPDELLRALDELEQPSVSVNPMEQLVSGLMWETRFQMLEEELARRMKKQSA